jgi:hypothetical protein
LYTPGNPRNASGLRKGVYNLTEVILNEPLNEAPLGLSKFISDYLPCFEKMNIFFNIITKKV